MYSRCQCPQVTLGEPLYLKPLISAAGSSPHSRSQMCLVGQGPVYLQTAAETQPRVGITKQLSRAWCQNSAFFLSWECRCHFYLKCMRLLIVRALWNNVLKFLNVHQNICLSYHNVSHTFNLSWQHSTLVGMGNLASFSASLHASLNKPHNLSGSLLMCC